MLSCPFNPPFTSAASTLDLLALLLYLENAASSSRILTIRPDRDGPPRLSQHWTQPPLQHAATSISQLLSFVSFLCALRPDVSRGLFRARSEQLLYCERIGFVTFLGS